MKQPISLILALSLLLALLLSACAQEKAADKAEAAISAASQVEVSAKTDTQTETATQQIVATVNGAQITYSTFAVQMASVEAMYSALTDTLGTDEINQKLTEQAATVLENLIMQEILAQKVQEYEITLTAQQQTQVETAWDAMQARFLQTISANYPTLEGEELNAMVLLALENSGIDEQMVVDSARSSALIENLREKVDEALTQPTDEDIRAYYETLLSQQRTEFDEDGSAFETAMLGGAVVVYIPDEYRVIHEWEFRYEDDVIALLKQLETLDTEASDAYEDTLAAEQARTLSQVSMVQSLLAGGSDFDTLYENANPGQTPRVNYIAAESSRFSEEYYGAAMQIPAEGAAAAQPLAQNYGYTLLYWADTLAPGEISLYDVEEAISAQLLTQARDENWKTVQAQWRAEAEVQINESLITYS